MNRPNYRKAAVVALTLATLAAPAFAFADTSSSSTPADASSVNSADIQTLAAQLQSLLAQVAALKAQLARVVGGALPGGSDGQSQEATTTEDGRGAVQSVGEGETLRACPAIGRDLREGEQGGDVTQLQQFLQQYVPAFASTTPTGFFGPKTAEAMREFQLQNGIASSTDGSVGPMTRAFFGKHCGQLPAGQGVGSTTPSGEDRGRGPQAGVRAGEDRGGFVPQLPGSLMSPSSGDGQQGGDN